MADRWLTPIEKLRIYQLRHLYQLSYEQIAKVIEKESEDGRRPNRSTIKRNCDKFPLLPLDLPWQWEKMEEYGIPWEASRVLMDCWTRAMEEEVGQEFPRPFSVRLARWCHRVCCAYPSMQAYYLLAWAREYGVAEMAKDVLGEEIDTGALTAYLCIQPEESERHAVTYHRLADLGLIKELPLGPDARAELELEAKLYPEDPSVKEALEELDSRGEPSEAESELVMAVRRAEFQRRQALMKENWEKLGSPKVIRSSDIPQLLPGEFPSAIDVLMSSAELRLEDDNYNANEETELC